jgi:hypothetical protein
MLENRPHEAARSSSADEKVVSLRANRRARGLCQFCAEKWFRVHKCATTIQLHDVHELWELLQGDSQLESGSDVEETNVQINMLLSQEAATLGSPMGSSSKDS